MKNQAEVHALLLEISAAFEKLAVVIGADDPDPNPYVFVPGDDRPVHTTPRSWAYAYSPPPKPTRRDWMESIGIGKSLVTPLPTVEEYVSALVTERKGENPASSPMIARHLEFKNGTRLSVQASRAHYAEPRNDTGPWTHFEAGFADRAEFPELLPYAEDPTSHYSVYSYVPAKVIGAIIARCGGVIDEA
jgi:hypothetical protein